MADFPGRPAVTGVSKSQSKCKSKSQSKCKCQVSVTSEESYKVRIDLLCKYFNIEKKNYFEFLNIFTGYLSCFFILIKSIESCKVNFHID
jgi:hypothetical protein